MTAERLLKRKTQEVNVDGQALFIQELSAREVFAIWDLVEAAESSQDRSRLYLELVSLGLRDADGRVLFESAEDVADLPSRIVIPLAEHIMRLSEIGIDGPAGNASGGPSDA